MDMIQKDMDMIQKDMNMIQKDMNISFWVIVFEKNKQRVQNFENSKQKLPFLQKFPAVDTINEKGKWKKNDLNTKKIMNDKLKGKPGCNLSHQLLWKNHLETDKEWLLVLEDDTYVDIDNIDEFIQTMNRLIKFDTSFIQLETRKHHLEDQKKYPQKEIEGLFQMKPQCGTSAYLISKKGIQYFFSFLPWDKYIDVYTCGKESIEKLKSLCYVNKYFYTVGSQRMIDKDSQMGSLIYENRNC